MVLYAACLHYAIPATLISDSGGAFTSNEFEAVCHRLQIHHELIESTTGERYLNWMETHFNVQRRLYDYRFSLTTTPTASEQAHQAFMELYNTTAHQGLLKDQFDPSMPLMVLGDAKGRTYSPEELGRKFSHALLPRTTNQSIRLCDLASLPLLLCRSGGAQDAGLALGLWRAIAGGVIRDTYGIRPA
jgi:hypothetical protein